MRKTLAIFPTAAFILTVCRFTKHSLGRHEMKTSTKAHDTRELKIPIARLLRSFTTPCVLLDCDGDILDENAAARALAPSLWLEEPLVNWLELRDMAPDFPESLPLRTSSDTSGLDMSLSRLGEGEHAYLLHSAAPDKQFIGLLARATHDIRTELQTILAANDLLRSSDPVPAGERLVLHDNIGQAVERALELVDATLDLTRGEYGRLAPVQDTFAPSCCVAAIAHRMTPLARSNGNAIVLDIPEAPTDAIGRPDLIETIAQNLLSNAVKNTRNGRITVSVSELVKRSLGRCDYTIAVRDNGIGIPEHEQARILVPFQAGEGRQADWRSSGIGTFIIQKSLDMLGGALRLDSTPGDGACFTASFSLPLAESGKRPDPGLDDKTEVKKLTGARVLLVEDNEVNRSLLLRVLRSAGASVDGAKGGCDALEQLQAGAHQPYDLVLLDLTMSGFDGLALACRLLRMPKIRPPRIAAISGQSDPDGGFSYAPLGISEIIRKPVRPRELVRRVHALLSARPASVTYDQPEVLNDTIVDELRAEMGGETAADLMRRACDEAQALLAVLSKDAATEISRDKIHSALGSAGMTGLFSIEHALRVVQAVSKLRPPGSEAMHEALHLLAKSVNEAKDMLS